MQSIVDVRKIPASRRHPHFARDQLSRWLPAAGVAYRWEPRLGGFRRPDPNSPNFALRQPSFRAFADWMGTGEFKEAFEELLDHTSGLAIMCAESLWWRCHRRLIADAGVLLGNLDVVHLGHDGRRQQHLLTEVVRVQAGTLVYDLAASAGPGPDDERPDNAQQGTTTQGSVPGDI